MLVMMMLMMMVLMMVMSMNMMMMMMMMMVMMMMMMMTIHRIKGAMQVNTVKYSSSKGASPEGAGLNMYIDYWN